MQITIFLILISLVFIFIPTFAFAPEIFCGLEFLFALVFLIADFFIALKGSSGISEITSRFALDIMNHKFFEIDRQLTRKEISEGESEMQKHQIQKEVNFYSEMDGAAKFFTKIVKATIILWILNFEAVLFTVPQLVFGIAVQMNPAEFDTKFFNQYSYAKNYEDMNPDNLFQDEISNNPKVQSMIYFHKTKNLTIGLKK